MAEIEPFHRWERLADFAAGAPTMASAQLAVVAAVWRPRRAELAESPVLTGFNQRLARRWSIETGAIEGLYRIDRGITETLIDRGIEAALIPHGSTDRPAADIVRIIRDHAGALKGVFDFVKSDRLLSISYIRELHQELCRGQDTVVGMDQFGNRTETTLARGAWKTRPNSPRRTDNRLHEYCPPEHVQSEMDELVRFHRLHMEIGLAPEVEAAWLHHRFTQIHPFEDGNGRVARALATLVLLKAGLFPFVVESDTERGPYLDNLEAADRGDLRPLVDMVARQQQGALLQALDLSRDVLREHEAARGVEASVRAAAELLKTREFELQEREFGQNVARARDMKAIAEERLQSLRDQLETQLAGTGTRAMVYTSAPEQGFWFRRAVIDNAKAMGYFANTDPLHEWARLALKRGFETQIFVSIHQVGRHYRGLLTAIAFIEVRDLPGEGGDPGHRAWSAPKPLVTEGFAITLGEDSMAMAARFRVWLDDALAKGIDEWAKAL